MTVGRRRGGWEGVQRLLVGFVSLKMVESRVILRSFVLLVCSFIGEESVAAGEKSVLTDNPTWIIDPIDGTTNFVHRYGFRLSVLPVYTIAQLSFTAIHPGRCTLWRIV